ncbi:GyrI-like domain-containing protein [Paenibacillus terrigena]|uniref:GyrI-like domain-containing protein n=1 Tax=Paenibacillus terrigena TaxID=369333 RepID=UPI0028D48C71|nr:GyrI-like domain-containing protein [Paenibacillus terrigena]
MENRSPNELISLLVEQKSKINDQMRVLERIDQLLTKKISTLVENKDSYVDSIEIVPRAEEYLALSESIYLKEEKDVQRILYTYMENCKAYNLYDGISISSMSRFDDIVQGEILNYEYVYTQLDQESDYPHIFIKPEGHYLTAYNKGGWDALVRTYSKIITYAEQNNLSLIGYSYEQSIIDESTTSDGNDYITKISIQISTESMTNTQKRRSNQK